KKEDKKTISIRLFEQEDEALRRIKDKYGITKSEVVETLIKKYAKEEYGAY
ncbi:TPA: Cop-6 protein, partial [Staphylococcus aureus]|nr:Cop-6 protein [Staphylococcus aureus]